MTTKVGPISGYDPRSAIGPASNFAPQGFTEGYNPPSHNVERNVNVNAFIDAYWSELRRENLIDLALDAASEVVVAHGNA